jgi:hypothetical protein
MKHPSSQQFFAYWEQARGEEQAPTRATFEPGPVRHLLADSFVLAYAHSDGFPFRVAGTRLCALLGRDLKGTSFSGLWHSKSRGEIADIVGIVAEETLGTVAGATAMVNGMPLFLELLLLPLVSGSQMPVSVTGILAPLTVPATPDYGSVQDLILTSWRHVGHRRQSIGKRALRKLAAARGFIVYEGLR